MRLWLFLKRNAVLIIFDIIAIASLLWAGYTMDIEGNFSVDGLMPYFISLVGIVVINIKASKGIDVTSLIFKELHDNKMYVSYTYLQEKYGFSIEKIDEIIKKYADKFTLDPVGLAEYLDRSVLVHEKANIKDNIN